MAPHCGCVVNVELQFAFDYVVSHVAAQRSSVQRSVPVSHPPGAKLRSRTRAQPPPHVFSIFKHPYFSLQRPIPIPHYDKQMTTRRRFGKRGVEMKLDNRGEMVYNGMDKVGIRADARSGQATHAG